MGLIVLLFSESEGLLGTISFIMHFSHAYEKSVCVRAAP